MRRIREVTRREGVKVRSARRRRGWSQRTLGQHCELGQTTISKLERGEGATLSLACWQRVADALEMSLDLKLGRDQHESTADAGHLALQELVMRLGRAAGYRRAFELPTRPADPSLSVDVGLVDHARRRLVLVECVNSLRDLGAAVRSSDRKTKEAEGLALSLGHGRPYAVHVCWILRATRRNRELVARYPEIFASRFPGSSRAWVDALTSGQPPPGVRGLVWADVRATRLFPWRRRI
ncbi:MAG TPA: helix-turn-helix transcriptional regulator [Candidatus Limnocylindria bacterium]|nr:helix-turn-helix transcriptional regulator [Candidatus Limnocylindria bacterium]